MYYLHVDFFRQHNMENFLSSIGLNSKEIKIFITLISLGAQPVSVLAKHVGLARSTTYSLLDGLIDKKVIRTFERFGIKYVQTLSLEALQLLLEREKLKLEEKQKTLLQIAPEYKALQHHLGIKPRVNFYEGFDKIPTMFESALRKNEFMAYFNAESAEKHMSEYVRKVPETIKRMEKSARELVVQNAVGTEYRNQYETNRHQIRYLPKEFEFESDTIITEEAVYMIAYGENEISGIEIFQKSLAETQRVLFEYLWKSSK